MGTFLCISIKYHPSGIRIPPQGKIKGSQISFSIEVTHFTELTILSSIYPNISNKILQTKEHNEKGKSKVEYTYKVGKR